jgi:hypothetical protein
MTWLHMPTDLPDRRCVGVLAESLRVQPIQAFGHFIMVCCAAAVHQPNGDLRGITVTTLEDCSDEPENLQTLCGRCNQKKGPQPWSVRRQVVA